jgi:hypothetical protein
MCHNSTVSYSFAAVGVIVALYIQFYEAALKKTGIQYLLAFYSGMEFLQGTQYFFINECSNVINKYLTEIAYLFVIVQPFMWNLFYYFNSNAFDKQIFLTALSLFVVWMAVNILSRILYDKNKYPQTKDVSVHASDEVCTKRKLTHLYWEWTSANFSDINANFLTYLMVWFVPALLSLKYRTTSLLLICSAIIAWTVSCLMGEPFVFTSLWCYVSVPIVLFVIINIIMSKYY